MMMYRSTPNAASARASQVWYCAYFSRPSAIRFSDTAASRYSAMVLRNSAWLWLFSITVGSGVTPRNAASNVLRETPRACASGQSDATKFPKWPARAATAAEVGGRSSVSAQTGDAETHAPMTRAPMAAMRGALRSAARLGGAGARAMSCPVRTRPALPRTLGPRCFTRRLPSGSRGGPRPGRRSFRERARMF